MNVLATSYDQVGVFESHPGMLYIRCDNVISKMDITALSENAEPGDIKEKIVAQQSRHLEDSNILKRSINVPEDYQGKDFEMILWDNLGENPIEIAKLDFERDLRPVLETCDAWDNDVMFAMYGSNEPMVFC
jgi:hypothetical protein